MPKGRPYEWPDPKDRSPNNPQVIVEPEHILALYKKETGQTAQNVSASVRNQFEQDAKKYGWDEVNWVNNSCVLKKEWNKP